MISGAAETAEEASKGTPFDSKGLQYTESFERLSGDLASVFHLHDLAALTVLDPLADKCLVLGAFITFIFLSEQIQVWMVLCILARDIVITCFRYLAIYQGKTLQTSRLAKVKTAFQMFSIMVILTSFMVLTVREYDLINQQYHSALESGLSRWDVAGANIRRFLRGQYDDFFFGLTCFLPYYLMILTTIITILSLLRYLFTNYKLLHGPIPVIRPKEKEKGYWQDLDKGRISALNKFRRSAGERKSG
ncbi:MAG: CDP-alcohol phosphatidyltransferase family protein [Deltaproteobacteria bacterium]|nr:CDP-alcohol phosphatidyltransferase family protein [Deltaproteobacteria bacterium]